MQTFVPAIVALTAAAVPFAAPVPGLAAETVEAAVAELAARPAGGDEDAISRGAGRTDYTALSAVQGIGTAGPPPGYGDFYLGATGLNAPVIVFDLFTKGTAQEVADAINAAVVAAGYLGAGAPVRATTFRNGRLLRLEAPPGDTVALEGTPAFLLTYLGFPAPAPGMTLTSSEGTIVGTDTDRTLDNRTGRPLSETLRRIPDVKAIEAPNGFVVDLPFPNQPADAYNAHGYPVATYFPGLTSGDLVLASALTITDSITLHVLDGNTTLGEFLANYGASGYGSTFVEVSYQADLGGSNPGLAGLRIKTASPAFSAHPLGVSGQLRGSLGLAGYYAVTLLTLQYPALAGETGFNPYGYQEVFPQTSVSATTVQGAIDQLRGRDASGLYFRYTNGTPQSISDALHAILARLNAVDGQGE